LQRLIMAIKAGINRCGCMGHLTLRAAWQ